MDIQAQKKTPPTTSHSSFPSSPIVFSLKWPHTCEAALVMATMAEESPAPSSSQQRRGEKSKKSDRPRRQSQDRSSARLVAEEDSEEMQPQPPQHSLPLTGNPRISTQVAEIKVPGCRTCLLIPSFRLRPRAPSVWGSSRPPPRPSRPSTPQGCWERTTEGRTKWSAQGGNVGRRIRTLEKKHFPGSRTSAPTATVPRARRRPLLRSEPSSSSASASTPPSTLGRASPGQTGSWRRTRTKKKTGKGRHSDKFWKLYFRP